MTTYLSQAPLQSNRTYVSTGATSGTCTFTSNLTAGSRIVVCANDHNNAGWNVTSITDTAGNTYVKDLLYDNHNQLEFWSAPVASGAGTAPTVTVHMGGTDIFGFTIIEIPNVPTSGYLGGTTDGATTAKALDGSLTATATGCAIVYATCDQTATGTITKTTATTTLQDGHASTVQDIAGWAPATTSTSTGSLGWTTANNVSGEWGIAVYAQTVPLLDRVGSYTAANTTTVTSVFASGSLPTSGSAIVVGVGLYFATGSAMAPVTSVTDSSSNTYTLVSGSTGWVSGSQSVGWYQCANPIIPGSGTLTITVHLSATGFSPSVQAFSVNGWVDAAGGAYNPSNSYPSIAPSATSTVNGDLFLGLVAWNTSSAVTVTSSNFTWLTSEYATNGGYASTAALTTYPAAGSEAWTVAFSNGGQTIAAAAGVLAIRPPAASPLDQTASWATSTNGPVTSTFPTNPTSGAGIVVAVSQYFGTAIPADISSIADNAAGGSNTYTLISGSVATWSGASSVAWYYCASPVMPSSGALAITLTMTASGYYPSIQAFSVNGSVDAHAAAAVSNAGGATGTCSESVTSTVAGDLFLGACAADTTNPNFVSGNWAWINESTSNPAALSTATLASTPAAGSQTWTVGFEYNDLAMSLLAIKPAASGALSAASTSTSTCTATLSVSVPLTAAGSSASSATAALSGGGPSTLAGASSSASSCTAALTVNVPLTASSTSSSSAVGTVATPILFDQLAPLTQTSASTATTTFGAQPRAGSKVIVTFGWYNGSGCTGTPTITDNGAGGGNTYTKVASVLSTSTHTEEQIWCCDNIVLPSSGTLAVTGGASDGSTAPYVSARSFLNAPTGAPTSTATGTAGAGTTVTTSSAVGSGSAPDLLIAFGAGNGGGTASISSPFTSTTTSGNENIAEGYWIGSATQTPTLSYTGSGGIISIVAAGWTGGATLAAASASASTSTANLSVSVPLNAASTSASTGAAVLSAGTTALSAASSSVSAASATLTSALPLASAASSASTATAHLTVTVPLVASGTSASSGTAAASVALPLTASGTSASSGTAALTSSLPLSAASTSTSSATAALTGSLTFAGASSSASAATAVLTVVVPLSAASTSASTAAATPTLGVALAGASTSASSATAALILKVALTAASTSSSSATAAAPTLTVALTGASTSASSATAALNGQLSLSAAGSSTSSATASLSAALPLTGSAASASSATAALTVSLPLAASSSSASAASGALTSSGPGSALATNSTSASTATAVLTVTVPLGAGGLSSTSATAALSVRVPLAAGSSSGSSASATLFVALALTAAITSSSSASAVAPVLRVALGAAAGSISAGTALLRIALPLTAGATSHSSSTALLGVYAPTEEAIRTFSVITTLGPTRASVTTLGPTAAPVTTTGPTTSAEAAST